MENARKTKIKTLTSHTSKYVSAVTVQVRLCHHRTSSPSPFRTFVVRLSLYDAMLAGIFKLKPFSNWIVSLFTITETAHATLPFLELPKLPMPHHQLIHVSKCNLEQALLGCQIIIFVK